MRSSSMPKNFFFFYRQLPAAKNLYFPVFPCEWFLPSERRDHFSVMVSSSFFLFTKTAEFCYELRCKFSEKDLKLDFFGDIALTSSIFMRTCVMVSALADGHAAILCRFEIVGDAERRTDLIFAAVTLADAARLRRNPP